MESTEQQQPQPVVVVATEQSQPEGGNDTSQRTAQSLEPSPSENNCPICLEKLGQPQAILHCIHKYHSECIADWLLECNQQKKQAICTIDKVPIGEELIVNGETTTVKELMQKRKKEKAKMRPKKAPEPERHSDNPEQPVRRGRGRPRGSGRGRGRGAAAARNRSRSRSRNGNRPQETSSRRDLANSARNTRKCVLCLRVDPGLTLVEKPCPGRTCGSTVPQHLECLERLGNRNGSTDCYECDRRRHPGDYRNGNSSYKSQPDAAQQDSFDSELEGSSFHPGVESPSESISPSPEEESHEVSSSHQAE